MSGRTEEAYVFWIRRYIVFHGRRHPGTLGAEEVTRFLSFRSWPGTLLVPTGVSWADLMSEFMNRTLASYIGWAILIATLGTLLIALGVLDGRDM